MVRSLTISVSLLGLFLSPVHILAEVADDATLKAAGIRKLTSEHLTLYTDLPSQREVDDLPKIFDLAIPQWSKFFGTGAETFQEWKVTACVIQNKERFQEYGLLPRNLPPFLHGFQMFDKVWVYEQPSPYYRQHLLLHEGTHSAMNRMFGRVGPVWYREGIAEMLGTHRFENGKLTIPYFPVDRKRVEYWGRIKIVADDIKQGNVRSISSIVNTQTRDFLKVESYAWSWALQSFGHKHQKFAPIFRGLQDEMHHSTRGVTRKFMESYYAQQYEIDCAWELFLAHLDYGYDSSHETVYGVENNSKLEDGTIRTVTIAANKGWQSTGIVLPPNAKIDLAATGKFQVALELVGQINDQASQSWMSEPQGVTIQYYQGEPLGKLIAAIVNSSDQSDTKGLTQIQPVGRRGQVTSKSGGVLYLRPNERADRLGDNEGQITVKLRLAKQ